MGRRVVVWLVVLGFAVGTAGCGAGPGAVNAGDRCVGEREAAAIHLHGGLPTTSGAEKSWVEITASRLEPNAADNRVFLDDMEIPVVRVVDAEGDGHAMDATAGQLTPRQSRTSAFAAAAHVLGLRIPPGVAPGMHAISLRTCGVASAETVGYEVVTGSAPEITSIRLVRGEVWPSLFIKGSGLAGAEEIYLVANGTHGGGSRVLALTSFTRIDDGQLRVSVERPGTYDVFVRNAHGLGGGPPNGQVTIR